VISQVSRLEKWIMHIYVFLLPVTSGFYKDSLHSLSYSASFLPHIAGLALMALHLLTGRRVYRPSRLVKLALLSFMLLNLSSMAMAVVQWNDLGTLFGRDAITAAFPQITYYAQIMLVLIYNDYMLRHIELRSIVRTVLLSFAAMMAIGYLQAMVLTGGGGIAIPVLDLLDRLFFIDDIYVISNHKVNLLTLEASTAGAYIAIWILPLLLSLTKNKQIRLWQGGVALLILLPVIIFNNSSSGMFGIAACLMFFLVLFSFKNRILVWNIRLYAFIGAVCGVALFWEKIQASSFFQSAFVKIIDTENLSTLHRTTSIYTNFLSFVRHPLFGVGNGIQGFYYIKYFPQWGFGSFESDAMYHGEAGWPGAGAFIPSYISAFGLFGLLLLAYLIYRIYQEMKSLKTEQRPLFDFLVLSFGSMLFQFYTTLDIIGNFHVIFVLSLACFQHQQQNLPVCNNLYTKGLTMNVTECIIVPKNGIQIGTTHSGKEGFHGSGWESGIGYRGNRVIRP